MFKIICITNRSLCDGDFLERINEIAKCGVDDIILREKDFNEIEYKKLANKVMIICQKHQQSCTLHSFVDVSIELNAKEIHLPLPILRDMSQEKKSKFLKIGASCHSVSDAIEAEKLGCTYITLGHIFATDCKKGLKPRGVDLLEEVCKSVSIPVYAIGGISENNIDIVRNTGASGACIMSGFMQCKDIQQFINSLQ